MDTSGDQRDSQIADQSRQSAARGINLDTILATQNRSQAIGTTTQNNLYSDPSNHRYDHFSGAIKQIHVKNFMTYDETTWTPGMGLNVICGPNGSGKSSMSSAICIGLNGKPTLTGRESKNARYIKNGAHICEITVTLYGKSKHKQWRVRRILSRDAEGDPEKAKSAFKIERNNEGFNPATAAKVNELVTGLGIDFTN